MPSLARMPGQAHLGEDALGLALLEARLLAELLRLPRLRLRPGLLLGAGASQLYFYTISSKSNCIFTPFLASQTVFLHNKIRMAPPRGGGT